MVALLLLGACTDHPKSEILRSPGRQKLTEISKLLLKLTLTLHVEEEVLWLDVPVDDLHGVTVGQRLGHLFDVLASSWLVKFLSLRLLKTFVHLPTGSILKDQVDFCLVVKVSKETQNVRMSQMGLDLDLSPELVLHLRFDQLRFEEDFQCNNIFALLLSCQIHVSELPLTQRSADVKVFQCPFISNSTCMMQM